MADPMVNLGIICTPKRPPSMLSLLSWEDAMGVKQSHQTLCRTRLTITTVFFSLIGELLLAGCGGGSSTSSSSGMMSGGIGGGMMRGTFMAGTITASEVELEPQGLSGAAAAAISSGATTRFTLNLSSGCAFTTLTGATSVTIYQHPQTTVVGQCPIASGSSVHAFGLLFFDSGQWKMVASRIGAN